MKNRCKVKGFRGIPTLPSGKSVVYWTQNRFLGGFPRFAGRKKEREKTRRTCDKERRRYEYGTHEKRAPAAGGNGCCGDDGGSAPGVSGGGSRRDCCGEKKLRLGYLRLSAGCGRCQWRREAQRIRAFSGHRGGFERHGAQVLKRAGEAAEFKLGGCFGQ